MKRMKKILSLLLAFSMLLTLSNTVAFAADDEEEDRLLVENAVLEDGDWDSDEMFAGYVDRLFDELSLQSSGRIRLRSYAASSARSKLTQQGQAAYDIMLTQINAIVAGTQTSTVFNISSAEMHKDGLPTLLYALKLDHPYEMFWFNNEFSYSFYSNGTVASVTMQVAAAYRAESYSEGTPAVKAGLTGQISAAISNAADCIAEAKTRGDNYHKLIYIKETLCDLVEYNTAAAAGGVAYGDPWQMIYVFDGDTNTNVVCEGYAKAFQYLCENAELNNAASYIVTGDMGGGGHMWNIVTMEDGKNYLVDVTNCDGISVSGGSISCSVSYPDRLFLVGASGKLS